MTSYIATPFKAVARRIRRPKSVLTITAPLAKMADQLGQHIDATDKRIDVIQDQIETLELEAEAAADEIHAARAAQQNLLRICGR